MYHLILTKEFEERYINLIKGNVEKEKRTEKALRLLQNDPFYPSLKSHKATTKNYGVKWSSWITGDLRIIWEFDKNKQLTLLLLSIGTHSGKSKAYK